MAALYRPPSHLYSDKEKWDLWDDNNLLEELFVAKSFDVAPSGL